MDSRITYFPLPDSLQTQNEAYLDARDREKRLIQDEEVRQLPWVKKGQPHHHEWRLRAFSLKKLIKFLGTLPPPQRILDLGCGNGWMSHALASAGHQVWGMDINTQEVEQANRVFDRPNLHWIVGNAFEDLPIGPFDVIVISAALQYFESPPAVIQQLSRYLSPEGGVMIMDTSLYLPHQVAAAQQRSRSYYEGLGTATQPTYHHHTREWLAEFSHRWIYTPSQIAAKLRRFGVPYNPFPMVWVQPGR